MSTPVTLAISRFARHRGQAAREQLVLALVAPADDQVVAFPDLDEQLRDVGRIVLQVGVHGHQRGARGMLDAGHHGGGLAAVAAELDHLDPRIGGGQGGAAGEGVIAAAVVDEDDLEGERERRHGVHDRLVQRADARLLVERGHDHRQVERASHRRPHVITGRLVDPPLPIAGQAVPPTLLDPAPGPAAEAADRLRSGRDRSIMIAVNVRARAPAVNLAGVRRCGLIGGGRGIA